MLSLLLKVIIGDDLETVYRFRKWTQVTSVVVIVYCTGLWIERL